jgi:RND family efflux transporter MFP subunit
LTAITLHSSDIAPGKKVQAMKLLSRFFALVVIGCTTGGVIVAWNQAMNRRDSVKSGSSTAVKHAEVAHPVNEADLNSVKLTADARRRLGVEVQPVQRRSMPRCRAFGAELVLPTGAAVTVSAPVAGTLNDPARARFPQVGQPIQAGAPVLSLLPLLTPERSVLTPAEQVRLAEVKATIAQTQIEAEGQVRQAKVQVDAAQISLKRAERLLSDNVGTRRAVDDARAQLELAEEALAVANQRKQLVDEITLEEEAGTLEPISITSPLSGIVRATHVQTGQLISAGMPLFEVMNDEVLWIKVPVYVGELEGIDTSRGARLTALDGRPSEQDLVAEPVTLPPTALPLSAAVDLYYEVSNADHKLRPGQRITAHLVLLGDAEVDAVPWSAVFHDIYGGQWVYEQVADRTYVRRRVEVGWIDQGWAALRRGPSAGAEIVTAGVAELAGSEFGFAK